MNLMSFARVSFAKGESLSSIYRRRQKARHSSVLYPRTSAHEDGEVYSTMGWVAMVLRWG